MKCNKLKFGDEIRVISPARSMKIITEELREIAKRRFEEMGLKVTFAKHVEECDDFSSSSIESRVEDIHEAFLDKNVKAVITTIGGYNSNQLLRYIDYEIIKSNPKIFCGFSDITALCCAIYKKTGLITYYGPHFSSFAMEKGIEYTREYFKKSFLDEESKVKGENNQENIAGIDSEGNFNSQESIAGSDSEGNFKSQESIDEADNVKNFKNHEVCKNKVNRETNTKNETYMEIKPSEFWSDDPWYRDQESRNFIPNDGYLVINEGEAEGTLIGGNLCTFNLLQGTEYMPSLRNSILFIEDDDLVDAETFDRDLQSTIHQPGFEGVRGILIGRFQKASAMTNEKLIKIIKTKRELNNIPVMANVNFGHVTPIATIPIGGWGRMSTGSKKIEVRTNN